MSTQQPKFRIKLICTILVLLTNYSLLHGQSVKKLDLGEFTSVVNNSEYKVSIKQSNVQEVKATVDADIWNLSYIWVDNGVLYVDMKAGSSAKKTLLKKLESKLTATMELEISVKNIHKLMVNGNGSITSANSISAPSIELEVNGNGRINVDVKSTRVKASIFSKGELQITGYADQLNLVAAGDGNFNGTNFDVKKVKAQVRGNETEASLSVSSQLDIDVYGNGKVLYKGATKAINKHIYGQGSVLFRN